MVKWDITGGDCTASHIRLKSLLETDECTRHAKWDLLCAANVHTFLCGISLTGSLFVIDIGVLKECRRVDRITTTVLTPRIGFMHSNPAKIEVFLSNEENSIRYKVPSLAYLH